MKKTHPKKADLPVEQSEFTPSSEPKKETLIAQEAEKIKSIEEQRSGKKRGKLIFKIVFLILIFAISFYILFTLSEQFDDNDKIPFGALNLNWIFWLSIVAVFVAMLGLQTAKMSYLNRISFKKLRPGLALRVNLIGKFYDNITPMSTGGQPFQMYYYHKNGVDIGNATSIPTMNYIIQMYAWQIVSFVFLIADGHIIYDSTTYSAALTVQIMCWIGWTINMFGPVLFLSVAFAPKFAYWGARLICKIGHKLHLIKNYDAAVEKTYKALDSYKAALGIMGKQIPHILAMGLLSAAEFVLLLTVPVLLTHFVAGTDITFANWANMATLYCYVQYSVTFLPTPGAAGFTETSLALVFMGIATEGTLFWLLVMMRFFTYYIFIVLGLLVTLWDWIEHAIKRRLAAKRGGGSEPPSDDAVPIADPPVPDPSRDERIEG